MRKSLLMVGIPVSVLGLGLATFVALRANRENAGDTFARELEKADAAGVQLAQSQAANQFSLTETVPETKPEARTVIKRGNGPKAVRSSTPTVKAAPQQVATDVVEENPDLTVMHTAAAPTQAEVVVPSAPAPAPATEPAPAQDNGTILRGGNGSGEGRTGSTGSGGGWGGIFGVVIRGGGVDGDTCDLHRPPRSGRQGPVYGGNPGSGVYTGPIGRTAGSTIRGGGIQLPVGITSNTGSQARPRGR